jgi:DNA-directed RNA polymerase specialized sigma24 family protein
MKRHFIQQGRFATTQWHMVKQATEAPDLERMEALNDLLRRYVPAMVEYIKRRFHFSVNEAEDLVQQFVADRVLLKNVLAKATQERGKFRTFLMVSIQHFTFDMLRREKSLKRRPLNGFVSMDDIDANVFVEDSEREQSIFDEGFARQLIAEAVHRTHSKCVDKGKLEIWEILHARVLAPHLEGIPPEGYDSLVDDLGLSHPVEAQNKLATGKRIFRRCFRQVVEEFSDSVEDFDEEWAYFSKFFESIRQGDKVKCVS